MSVLGILRKSLDLLSQRDRKVLVLVCLIQFIISLLDLAGVLLLGVVAALTATAALKSSPISTGALGSILELVPDSLSFTVILAIGAAVALVLKSILGLLLNRKTFRFLAHRQAVISGDIAQRLLNRPLLEVQSRSSQEITIALTNGVEALTLTTLGQSVVIFSEASLVIVLFIGLIFIDPMLALFTLIFFGILVLLLQFLLGTWASSLGHAQARTSISSFESMQHTLRAYREISVMGRRSLFVNRFRSLRMQAAKVQADTFLLNQTGKYIFEIGLIVGAVLLVAFTAFTKDLISGIALITVFLAVSARVFPSLLRLLGVFIILVNAAGTAEVTLSLLDDLEFAELGADRRQMSPASVEKLTQSIREGFTGFIPSVFVSSISLGYPSATDLALDSISFEILPSQSVALVGATGAGKSTLADVILGVLLPDTGSVLISGVAPNECVTRWPGSMAYVPQDVAVLTGTVRENVALGIPMAFIDDSLVWEALERAQLATFLQKSRDGIDTVVGENGVQLSGGQRQRLGIARALYSRPKLLVLDEATSALDAETERIVTQTLDSLAGDVTLIVIAHRLATVRQCDLIIHLSGGRITGRGTFKELRAQVPEFNQQAELLGL